jgi:hypothetical protein
MCLLEQLILLNCTLFCYYCISLLKFCQFCPLKNLCKNALLRKKKMKKKIYVALFLNLALINLVKGTTTTNNTVNMNVMLYGSH